MNDKCDFEVRFGPDAWTVEYVEESGKFTFVFDCDIDEYNTKGTTKRLILSKGPPLKDMKIWECLTQTDGERTALMFERVKQYLSSLGYEVKVD